MRTESLSRMFKGWWRCGSVGIVEYSDEEYLCTRYAMMGIIRILYNELIQNKNSNISFTSGLKLAFQESFNFDAHYNSQHVYTQDSNNET